jgi:hypothetical protein
MNEEAIASRWAAEPEKLIIIIIGTWRTNIDLKLEIWIHEILLSNIDSLSTVLTGNVLWFCYCPPDEIINISLQCVRNKRFLGAFVNLRVTTISFIISLSLSLCPHGRTRLPLYGSSEIRYFRIVQRSVERIQVLLKSDKDEVYIKIYAYSWYVLLNFS